MPDPQWYIKRTRGDRSITVIKPEAEIQTFVETEMRNHPEGGDVIVYQRYGSCAFENDPTLVWTMGTPEPTP